MPDFQTALHLLVDACPPGEIPVVEIPKTREHAGRIALALMHACRKDNPIFPVTKVKVGPFADFLNLLPFFEETYEAKLSWVVMSLKDIKPLLDDQGLDPFGEPTFMWDPYVQEGHAVLLGERTGRNFGLVVTQT